MARKQAHANVQEDEIFTEHSHGFEAVVCGDLRDGREVVGVVVG